MGRTQSRERMLSQGEACAAVVIPHPEPSTSPGWAGLGSGDHSWVPQEAKQRELCQVLLVWGWSRVQGCCT